MTAVRDTSACWARLGPLHADPRAGVPRQLPGQGLGRGPLAGDPARLLPRRSSPRRQSIAGWPEPQYLFFVGCFFALNGLIETLFLENCNEFAELVRTGDLDFLLLRPIDEQFLITCRRIDWATAPNVLMGGGRDGRSRSSQMGWPFDPLRVLAFLVDCSPAGRRSPTASCCC